jgi:hypothetical protein
MQLTFKCFNTFDVASDRALSILFGQSMHLTERFLPSCLITVKNVPSKIIGKTFSSLLSAMFIVIVTSVFFDDKIWDSHSSVLFYYSAVFFHKK